jgi:hypothetical protein
LSAVNFLFLPSKERICSGSVVAEVWDAPDFLEREHIPYADEPAEEFYGPHHSDADKILTAITRPEMHELPATAIDIRK